jgi:hypothetical protein
MEGLVKIGRTTREPQERLGELSGATGVPTPFVLVYKEFFEDCFQAELAIHQILESNDTRVSKNREFFRAQPYDVIPIIQELKNNFPVTSEITSKTSTGIKEKNNYSLKSDLVEQGLNYMFGKDDYFQDYKEALKIFKRAANLGEVNAYRYLAIMQWFGLGCRKSESKTLELLKKGASLHGNQCFALMAIFFLKAKDYCNEENSYKSWHQFFNFLNNEINEVDVFYILEYVKQCILQEKKIEFKEKMIAFKEQILMYISKESFLDEEIILSPLLNNYLIETIADFEGVENGTRIFAPDWGQGVYLEKESLEINGHWDDYYKIQNSDGEILYVKVNTYSNNLYLLVFNNEPSYYSLLTSCMFESKNVYSDK